MARAASVRRCVSNASSWISVRSGSPTISCPGSMIPGSTLKSPACAPMRQEYPGVEVQT